MTVAFICAVRTSHFAVILETKRPDNVLRAVYIRMLIFRHACKLGLEGIVSKRKDSPSALAFFGDPHDALRGLSRESEVQHRRQLVGREDARAGLPPDSLPRRNRRYFGVS